MQSFNKISQYNLDISALTATKKKAVVYIYLLKKINIKYPKQEYQLPSNKYCNGTNMYNTVL